MRVVERLGESAPGRLIVGLGLLGFGIENVLFRHYVVARAAPWPADPSLRFAVACVTAAIFVATGAAFVSNRWLRPTGLASAALVLGWSLILHFPGAIAGPAWSGDWTNALKAVTIAAGVLGVALADGRPLGPAESALRTAAPYGAGAFFLLGGIQHFMFASFVVTLMPPFMPFALFWVYFAGVALIAAGLGFWTPRARGLAGTLAAGMVFSWVFLVHVPLVVRAGRTEWMGVFEALTISGTCLVLAYRRG